MGDRLPEGLGKPRILGAEALLRAREKTMKPCEGLNGRRRQAFSMLELLLILVTVGIVSAVGLLMLGRARHKSIRSQCVQNLKMIGTAEQMWLHEYEDRLPWQVPQSENGSQGLPFVFQQFRAMSNYLSSPKAVGCPGLQSWRPPAASWDETTDRNVGYGLNTTASGAASSILSLDMDIEGGEEAATAGEGSRRLMFCGDGSASISSRFILSKTNHVDSGQFTLIDGSVVAADNPDLQRQFRFFLSAYTCVRFLMPR